MKFITLIAFATSASVAIAQDAPTPTPSPSPAASPMATADPVGMTATGQPAQNEPSDEALTPEGQTSSLTASPADSNDPAQKQTNSDVESAAPTPMATAKPDKKNKAKSKDQAMSGQSLDGPMVRGSSLINGPVFDSAGDQVGVVEDFVLDENTGAIAAVIISLGEWLELEDPAQVTAVSMSALEPRQNAEAQFQTVDKNEVEFTLSADKEKLKNAQHFREDAYPEMNQQWAQQVAQITGDSTSEKFGKLVKATYVIDNKLQNQNKDEIGAVEELLVFAGNNNPRVAYAVIAVDDDWIENADDKRFVIPFTLVRESEESGDVAFVLRADKEKVSNAQTYDDDQLENINSLEWNEKAFDHFDEEPFWNDNNQASR